MDALSKYVVSIVCTAFLMLFGASVVAADPSLLARSYRPLAGQAPVNLQQTYGGEVLLVVNTASKCGFTPQFEALEALHARYRDQGFAVLGFPSGDFRDQEFEDEEAIREFCTLTYGVRFPMFEKVHVVGPDATGLYRDLAAATDAAPQWNFHKYLIGRDGRVLANWGSRTVPDAPEVVAAIERALRAPRPPR
ncbi:glutathione peroxidase [Luteimonas endophytica]